jgi:D-inositol-3-phosphate glycosyltransferase
MKEELTHKYRIAMLSVHSSPLGELGSQDTGGMSVYVRELACELGRSGHQVDIFTRSEPGGDDVEVPLYENVRLVYLKAGEGDVPKHLLHRYVPEFFQSLDRYRLSQKREYDLVHSHYWLSGEVGSLASRTWGVPHLMMFHTTAVAKNSSCSDEREPSRRLVAEKNLARRCTRIIAPTLKEKAAMIKHFSVSPNRVALVPCGVNLELFRPVARQEARRLINIDHRGPLVLSVGRFAPLKGLNRLIDAAALELAKGVDLKVLIVGGDGQHSAAAAALIRHAEALGISGSVVFTGRIAHERLPLYYSAADVLAVTSSYESFGLVALESLACGTPVIASPVGIMDRVIKDHATGIVVKRAEAGHFAEAIDSIISGEGNGFFSRDEMRNSVKQFRWSIIAAAIEDEYAAVAGSGGNGSLKSTGLPRTVYG